ncbi:hypothetical protein A8L51_21960 [Pantoea stewartii]|nr:hypothetical protein [Pantoea stewartii]
MSKIRELIILARKRMKLPFANLRFIQVPLLMQFLFGLSLLSLLKSLKPLNNRMSEGKRKYMLKTIFLLYLLKVRMKCSMRTHL